MFREISILLIFLTAFGAVACQNQPLDWWQKTVFYQIYPRSFFDTDGSGIGDLKGIKEKAKYFKDTGIGAIWISPVYQSPQVDFGYDISNHTAIDPIFGTLDDLISVKKTYHSLDIKVVLDFVPNHTSNKHIWFENSIKKIDPYTDYYVWKDPKGWNGSTPIPPNNWLSLVAGSAWHFVEERQQFYLGQFLPEQPELNYRNRRVIEELKDVLRFYLDLGFNGFRADAVPFLVEDERFLDEPPVNKTLAKENGMDYNNQQHMYTLNQPKTYDVLAEFRAVLDLYTKQGGPTRVLLSEGYTDIRPTIQYYGTPKEPISQIPFNLYLITNLNGSSNALNFENTVNLWLNNVPKGRWPNWQIGNHDNPRVPARFETSAIDAMNMLVQLLPGTAITYQGEEIGMEDTKLRPDQILDKIRPSRDPERTPFQWDSSLNAGFSTNKSGTWLPVNSNYHTLNLVNQKKDPKSHYHIYKSLVALRSTSVFQTGDYSSCVVSKWVFSFKRSLKKQAYIIVLNLNKEQEYVNLNTCDWNLSKNLQVVIASNNSEYNVDSQINISNGAFPMKLKSGLVLKVLDTNISNFPYIGKNVWW